MKAKKSLGQHFLTSERIAKEIADAAKLTQSDTALEIGPGTGMLTKELATRAGHVVAIEKDERLISSLRNQFTDNVTVIEGDVLTADLSSLQLQDRAYTAVANIPYYITGALIKKLLSGVVQPKQIVLLLQKEVAERIVADDRKESLLSISVKVYGTPRYVKTVPARHFKPVPKVDSAILAIENISRDFFHDIDEDAFFSLVKTGFAHKRKLLASNITPLCKNRADAEGAFATCNIPLAARAEELPVEEWGCLAQKLQ